MSKQISAAELAAVVARLLADPNCPVEVSGAETFDEFMTDIAQVVCKHCGGEVRHSASQLEDVWYVGIHGDNRLTEDGGIWREFDPDGALSDSPSASPLEIFVMPLRKTRPRHMGLRDLASGKITHPGMGVARVLESAGAIEWDRSANSYRLTLAGNQLLETWSHNGKGDLSDAPSAATGELNAADGPDAHAQASADPAVAMIHYTGYLAHDGVRVEADFRVPADASTTETDAAFLAALAMVADVNYLELGRLDAAEDTFRSSRSIFDEALNAKFVSIGDGQLFEMGARQDLIAQQVLQSYPADTVIGRDLYDENPAFGNCFNWMQDRFEFPAWEGRTIGEFVRSSGIHADQSTTNAISFTMPGYQQPRTVHVTLQEMKDAEPLLAGGWSIRSELELRFHHKAEVPCQQAYA